jgi:hypothetical protein
MKPRWNAYSSTVAEKLLIALTGLALFLYLVVHLGGHLRAACLEDGGHVVAQPRR